MEQYEKVPTEKKMFSILKKYIKILIPYKIENFNDKNFFDMLQNL